MKGGLVVPKIAVDIAASMTVAAINKINGEQGLRQHMNEYGPSGSNSRLVFDLIGAGITTEQHAHLVKSFASKLVNNQEVETGMSLTIMRLDPPGASKTHKSPQIMDAMNSHYSEFTAAGLVPSGVYYEPSVGDPSIDNSVVHLRNDAANNLGSTVETIDSRVSDVEAHLDEFDRPSDNNLIIAVSKAETTAAILGIPGRAGIFSLDIITPGSSPLPLQTELATV